MATNAALQLEKIKYWQDELAACSPEEIELHEADGVLSRDLMERTYNLIQCEFGIRQAGEAASEELLLLRDAILSDMLGIAEQREEINGLVDQASKDRSEIVKSKRLESRLKQQATARQEKIDNNPRKTEKSMRLARKALIQAAITRSQCQTVLADADLQLLGEKVAELFPAFHTHDGVRSNWGLRVRAGKASGS